MSKQKKTGVSIVICCFNSSNRLPKTLSCIASQRLDFDALWEVIVVDNASTDATSFVAAKFWPNELMGKLKITHEPTPGLTQARLRGIQEAAYDLISFIDDDNWVAENWISLVMEIMASDKRIGACGGYGMAIADVPLPAWFEQVKGSYAVGSQASQPGEVTTSKGLWGAGLTLRRQAWDEIVESGFVYLCSDRKGNQLVSGGDTELGYVLRLAGWKLWYDPRLQFKHYLPESRLGWNYLRRLHRGFGTSSVLLDPYLFRFGFYRTDKGVGRLKKTWTWQFVNVVRSLAKNLKGIPLMFSPHGEGDTQVLSIEFFYGRLLEMAKRCLSYRAAILEVEGKYPPGRFF